jgi:DNA-binding IclR family transcriptional regulator
MSKEKQAEILEEILQKEFGNLRSEAYLKMVADLDKYRSEGHVFKNGTMDPFTCELAIPVYNFENKAVGAISSTRLVFQKGSDAEIKEYIEKFKQIAENISFKQGYRS